MIYALWIIFIIRASQILEIGLPIAAEACKWLAWFISFALSSAIDDMFLIILYLSLNLHILSILWQIILLQLSYANFIDVIQSK